MRSKFKRVSLISGQPRTKIWMNKNICKTPEFDFHTIEHVWYRTLDSFPKSCWHFNPLYCHSHRNCCMRANYCKSNEKCPGHSPDGHWPSDHTHVIFLYLGTTFVSLILAKVNLETGGKSVTLSESWFTCPRPSANNSKKDFTLPVILR